METSVVVGTVLAGLLLTAVAASSSEGVPVGRVLPSVKGTSLAGREVRFPEDLRGKPAVLLVAYRRGTQEDVDLWIRFLSQRAPGLPFFEVPTISNPVWRPLSGWIDGGMRGGVPQEKWPSVVTLYGDAPTLRRFLGDRGGFVTHAVLLDGEGRVAWFGNEGFSEAAGRELLAVLSRLEGAP